MYMDIFMWLKERGIGEEVFLNPLYNRIKKHTNPGKIIIDSIKNNVKIEKLIDDYGPIVEDELMKNIGDPADADILMFVTLSIPSDLTKMTANLKAPIIINTEGRKAIQVIVENEDYKVKFNAYEAIQKMKEKAGE